MLDSEEVGTSVDSGLGSLALMVRFFGQTADPAQIRHDHGKTDGAFTAEDIVLCARRAGLRGRVIVSNIEGLGRVALPAITAMADGRFVVLARLAEGKVLVQDPAEAAPRLLPLAEFAGRWSGRLVLLTHREGLGIGTRRFDLSWFIPAVVRYRRLFAEVLLASFFLQFLGLVSPLFFQVVTDKVLVHRGLSSLDVLAVGLALVSVFEVLLGALRTYVFSHTTSRVDVELGAALFRHLMALPLPYFTARPAGTTVARVRELENIRSFLTGSALTLVMDVLFTVVFLAVMLAYSPLLTLIVAATIPLYVGLSLAVSPQLRRRIEEKFQYGARNQAFLVETVGAAETVKAMAIEPQMQRKWEDQLAAYVRAAFAAGNLNNWAAQVAQGINKAMVVGTLWLGARLVMEGGLTIGELVAFNMLAGRVSSPILRLAQLWQDFQQMRVSIGRLGDILDTPTERRQGAAALPRMAGAVRLEEVTFRYGPDRPEVLKGVSLEVPAGQSVGIVGPSGSGKSTLTRLIQRLYVPQSGRVLVDGVDLALVDTAWLRRQTGVVLQENVLFNASIRENIALADPSLPLERVVAASRLAAAHDFVMALPEAYDTRVEERGANLSGGQRQRIAIARALIGDPRILIFDEATSALDYESENLIRRNMAAMAKGRTVFIIAHRLGAVRHCDRILTLDQGRVVEDGSHDRLLAAGGRYAALWRAQESGDVG